MRFGAESLRGRRYVEQHELATSTYDTIHLSSRWQDVKIEDGDEEEMERGLDDDAVTGCPES